MHDNGASHHHEPWPLAPSCLTNPYSCSHHWHCSRLSPTRTHVTKDRRVPVPDGRVLPRVASRAPRTDQSSAEWVSKFRSSLLGAHSGVFGRIRSAYGARATQPCGRSGRQLRPAAEFTPGPRPNSHRRLRPVCCVGAPVHNSVIFWDIHPHVWEHRGGGAYSGVFGRIRSVCGARVTRRGRTGRWCAEYGRRACAALAHSPTATECLWAAMCTARTQTSILCAIHTSPYISFGWR